MNEKHRTVMNTGTVSLIMIFAVLALVTFALLSCSSASAQWRLAQKMADRTSVYYEAERQAAQILEQLDVWQEQLAGQGKTASKQELELWIQKLPDQPGEIVWQEDMICWRVPTGEKQWLEIQLQPSQQEGKAGWKLICWKLTEEQADREQQKLPLYAGSRGDMEPLQTDTE